MREGLSRPPNLAAARIGESPPTRGIAVDGVKHAGIVQAAVGKVRILQRDEIDAPRTCGRCHLTA